MEHTESISVEQCCIHYSIEASFVQQLDEHGLIALSHSGTAAYISHDQLPELEKYMHLYYDLDINMEGMDAIRHMLYRMQELQQEVTRLQHLLHER